MSEMRLAIKFADATIAVDVSPLCTSLTQLRGVPRAEVECYRLFNDAMPMNVPGLLHSVYDPRCVIIWTDR